MVRFLIDVGWRAEANQELDRLVKDFPSPELKERAAIARQYLLQLEAAKRRSEIDVSRKAQQYHRAAELIKSFNEKGIPTELLIEVREIERRDLSAAIGRSGHGRRSAQAGRSITVRDAEVVEGAGDRSLGGDRSGARVGPRPAGGLA